MMCDLSLAWSCGAVNATLTTHRVDDVPHEQVVDTVAVVEGSVWRKKRAMKDTQRFTHSSWSGLHVCVWVLVIVTVLQNFEWKPEENNGVNESIYTVTPKDLEKEKEAMKERGREGQKAGTGEGESQSRQTNAKIHTAAHTNSFSAIAQLAQCPPDHPKHTHTQTLIRGCKWMTVLFQLHESHYYLDGSRAGSCTPVYPWWSHKPNNTLMLLTTSDFDNQL